MLTRSSLVILRRPNKNNIIHHQIQSSWQVSLLVLLPTKRTLTTSTATSTISPPRTNWTRQEIQQIYDTPLLDLVHNASVIHRAYWNPRHVQRSTLLSIKTGGCSENCGYCSQSQHHDTFVKATPTLPLDDIIAAAKRAKASGSTRFCMGSAWREVGNKHAFKRVLEAVKEINGMGMEVCTTLGMLTPEQAQQLKQAGLTAYNHNIDTSPEYYPKVVTTRTYNDRLNTVKNVREAGISVCCGGIIGMGEEDSDRVGLLHTLATLPEHPESVPINALVPVKGTPLGDALIKAGKKTSWDEMVRVIATARILMPRTAVRLSAGRLEFPEAAQAMMFYAGANSIFTGDTLLTTANPDFDEDMQMFQRLGLEGKPAGETAKQEPEYHGSYNNNNQHHHNSSEQPITTTSSTTNSTSGSDGDARKALERAQRLLRIQNAPDVKEFAKLSSKTTSPPQQQQQGCGV
jgi:biotin synthase